MRNQNSEGSASSENYFLKQRTHLPNNDDSSSSYLEKVPNQSFVIGPIEKRQLFLQESFRSISLPCRICLLDKSRSHLIPRLQSLSSSDLLKLGLFRLG